MKVFWSDEDGNDTQECVGDLALDINDDCDNNDDGELYCDDDAQWYYSESYYS